MVHAYRYRLSQPLRCADPHKWIEWRRKLWENLQEDLLFPIDMTYSAVCNRWAIELKPFKI